MMNLISRQQLGKLLEQQKGACVTIYMPTGKMGADVQQNPIRFRNMVREAEERLMNAGLRRPAAHQLLSPALDFLRDTQFWRNQQEGLAVFCSSDFFQTFTVPLAVQQRVIVSDHFHIKPLLPLIGRDGGWYILSLAMNNARLLQCTHDKIVEVDLGATPVTYAAAMATDVETKSMQWHTRTQQMPSGGIRMAISHGSATVSDDAVKKRKIREFLLMLEKGVHKAIAGDNIPLILAGVEYICSMYKEVNNYPHLLDEGIQGNPELLSDADLRDKAWQVLLPRFMADRNRACSTLRQLLEQKKLTANSLREIISAAHDGKIDQLFIGERPQWGTYDPDERLVDIHDRPQPGDDDLLDLAAYETLKHGGVVYPMTEQEIPGDAPAAAIYRY